MSIINILQGYVLGNLAFAIYLETNPTIGDVWIRRNHNNKFELNFGSLLKYYTKPFTTSIFWNPRLWDLNPYIFSTLIMSGYVITCYYC